MADGIRAKLAERAWIRDALATLLVGIVVALATGVIPNRPDVYAIGVRYYGYPLYWRRVGTGTALGSPVPANLIVDVVVFWVGAAVALPAARRARDWVDERTG